MGKEGRKEPGNSSNICNYLGYWCSVSGAPWDYMQRVSGLWVVWAGRPGLCTLPLTLTGRHVDRNYYIFFVWKLWLTILQRQALGVSWKRFTSYNLRLNHFINSLIVISYANFFEIRQIYKKQKPIGGFLALFWADLEEISILL